MNKRYFMPKFFSVLLNILACLIAAAVILYRQDWVGSGDLYAFVFCTIPFALGLAVSGETMLYFFRNVPFVLRLPIIMVLAGLLSLGWAFSVVLMSGRWIEDLSIPVLVLWIGGSTVQLLFLDWRLPKPTAESKVSKVLLVLLSIPLTLVAGFLAIYFFSHVYSYLTRPERETFLFPKNFRGEVYVIFNQKNGAPKEYENKRRIYKIPDNGILFTQFKAEYGRVDQEFYFVDRDGKRTEFVINEEWISAKNVHNPQRDSAVVFRECTGQRGNSTPEDSTAFHFMNFIVKTYNQPLQSDNLLSFEKVDSIRAANLKNIWK